MTSEQPNRPYKEKTKELLLLLLKTDYYEKYVIQSNVHHGSQVFQTHVYRKMIFLFSSQKHILNSGRLFLEHSALRPKM